MIARNNHPSKESILAMRQATQDTLGLGIGAAQDKCAALVYTNRLAWQQWEAGERRMPPALWELAKKKTGC